MSACGIASQELDKVNFLDICCIMYLIIDTGASIYDSVSNFWHLIDKG